MSNENNPQSFGHRHGLTILMIAMGALFVLVIIAQMN